MRLSTIAASASTTSRSAGTHDTSFSQSPSWAGKGRRDGEVGDTGYGFQKAWRSRGLRTPTQQTQLETSDHTPHLFQAGLQQALAQAVAVAVQERGDVALAHNVTDGDCSGSQGRQVGFVGGLAAL